MTAWGSRSKGGGMRRLVVAALAVAVAGGIAGYAFGGSGTAGPHAYALVDPNDGSPRLVADHTWGFSAVTVGPFGAGDYCLTPAAGINVTGTAAVAGVEAFYSNVFGIAAVRYPASGPACPPGELEIKTFSDGPTRLTDQIGFTVNVP
jgi:hypothetical protein